MITLDRLKYFKEAANTQHVGLAASNLSISASVISSAIKTLEEELECKLFVRDKKKIKLNENGQRLLESSTSILQDIDKLYSETSNSTLQIKGHVRIGASPFLMKNILLNSFLRIQKTHPNITADFISLDTGIATEKVSLGSLDFALVFRSIEHQDIEDHPLYQGNFQIAVRKDHPILKVSKAKKISILNQLPSASFKPLTGPYYSSHHPILKSYKIKPIIKYRYNNNDTSINILKNTDAWALIPDLIIKSSKDLAVVQINRSWKAPFKVSLIKNKASSSSQIFNIILKDLKDSIH